MTEETEKVYSPREFALSLGFTEAEADQLDKAGAHATNIRQVAIAKDLPSMKQTVAKPETDTQGEVKKHRHYYRNDGTCACGAMRLKPKQSRTAR